MGKEHLLLWYIQIETYEGQRALTCVLFCAHIDPSLNQMPEFLPAIILKTVEHNFTPETQQPNPNL